MRINFSITVAAGTPVNIFTGSGAADTVPHMARYIFLQMKHGGTGVGYVMGGISRNRVPSAASSSDLSAEMAPATTTAPGGYYTESSDAIGIDANSFWVDGSVTGDKIIVTIDLK